MSLESPTEYEIAREKKSRMIKKMLFLGYQMGYDRPRSPAEQAMEKSRICWNHVERWCLSEKCSIRKTLRRYSVEELSQVLTQFELVYQSYLKEYSNNG